MSERKKFYVVLDLVKKIETDVFSVNLDSAGQAGMLPVFYSRKDAEDQASGKRDIIEVEASQ